MKHLGIKTVGLFIGVFAFISIQAQPNASEAPANKKMQEVKRVQFMKEHADMKRGGFDSQLKLTDDQKKAMKNLRMEQFKEMLPLENELKELKVHQQSLMSALEPDLTAINKNIDLISAAQNKVEKAKAKYMIKFKANLTEEQKIAMAHAFKMKGGKMGKFHKPEGRKDMIQEHRKFRTPEGQKGK